MQADLVILFIYFLKILLCSTAYNSLSVSTVRQRGLIHQDTLSLFGWEQGSFLTWFPRSPSSRLRSRSRSRTRLRLFSPPPKRKPYELDWRSHNLDWLQDIFGKCHSEGFACVNLWEKRGVGVPPILFFSAFSVTITAALWTHPSLCPPSPFVFLQIVLTGEKAGSTWLSVPDLPAHFPLFPQRFSNDPQSHVGWPVTALLETERESERTRRGECVGGGRGRGGGRASCSRNCLQTLYFYECTAELCCRGPPHVQLSLPLLGWSSVSSLRPRAPSSTATRRSCLWHSITELNVSIAGTPGEETAETVRAQPMRFKTYFEMVIICIQSTLLLNLVHFW